MSIEMILGVLAGAVVAALLVSLGFTVGVTVTLKKMADAAEEKECHREHTMHLVYRAMMDAHITQDQALDAVNGMQNKGILFREREMVSS
jgi:hypothetical protein